MSICSLVSVQASGGSYTKLFPAMQAWEIRDVTLNNQTAELIRVRQSSKTSDYFLIGTQSISLPRARAAELEVICNGTNSATINAYCGCPLNPV